jgi:hypothetical protein
MDNDKQILTVGNTIEIRYCFDDENGFRQIMHKKKSTNTQNTQQLSLFENADLF